MKELNTKNRQFYKILENLVFKRRNKVNYSSASVTNIIKDIKTNGDKAVLKYEKKFNKNIVITPSSRQISKSIKSLDKKVKQAIDLAELSNFVNALPERINTKIGERGVKLSGGQQQRVGIARALYHNPNILIFDEATSSLDENTEKNIMNAINKFYGLKTIIIIAHRINTLKKCDNIFLFEKGKIIETGSFKKLFEIKKR